MIPVFNIIFLAATIISAIGLIFIIYSRSIRGIDRKLYILALALIIGYLVSHAVHFVFMQMGDVTILDQSCHSFLLLIILVLTFFTYYYPNKKQMGLGLKLFLLIPSIIILAAIWLGYLIEESHAHQHHFEAHYSSYYSIYLIWYIILLCLSIYLLTKKIVSPDFKEYKTQMLTILLGLIVTNITAFVFGLYLPWILGFYYLVEISPLAFFIGAILTTTVAISKFNMFPAAVSKIQTFSLNKKLFFAALIVVPVVILLIQIPLGRILFDIQTSEEWQKYFIISIAGGILVAGVMAFIISRIIANPINKLTEITSQIQKGNYGLKVDINSNDEIGLLAETFNEMSDTLRKDTFELKEKQHRISLLINAFEKSNASICAFDVLGNILELNTQFAFLYKSSKEKLLKNNIYEITKHENSLNELSTSLAKYNGSVNFEEEVKISTGNGAKFLLLTISPFYFDTDQAAGNLLIAVDITHIKILENQLAKSEKLAALGKMAAVLAHEIKTPLTSIKMNSDILAESIDLTDEDKYSMGIINKEINRLNNLVKQVLQFARQVELDKKWFDIKDLFYDLLAQTELQFVDKRFNINVNVGNQKILADREKLFQVFLNIIENSFESAKENGLLTIESKTELKNLILRFTDDGNGIPYDLHEKIFEPFYTTKSSGTGLGLAVVQKIIEQHRGRITLKASDLGKTIFEIYLPLE
ncbi:MAG: hypothetical protein CVV23_07250 [Ignavibacteriae bacterium HGW-Ignavibacteriae-2]|nr:MAG: hypothetical protein CVV23_07250 [Ignavibacteriae bacterium HGW-Ignavibacteriae-2]